MSLFRRTKVCAECGVVYLRRDWDRVAPHLCGTHAKPVRDAQFMEDRVLRYLRVNKKRMAALAKEEERYNEALKKRKDGGNAYGAYQYHSGRIVRLFP